MHDSRVSLSRLRLSLGLTAKVVLSAGLLTLVFRRFDIHAVVHQLGTVRITWLIAAAAIFIANTFLLGLRWSILSLGLIDFVDALKYTWIGLFFGAVIPGGISGDIAKGLSLALKDKSLRTTLLPASILCDKILGLSVLIVYFLASILVTVLAKGVVSPALHRLLPIGLLIGSGSIVIVICCLLIVKGRDSAVIVESSTGSHYSRFLRALCSIPTLYARRRTELSRAVALSALGHFGNALAHWFILKSMSLDASFAFAFILYSTLSVVTMIPISISGLGVRDVTSAGLFAVFGLHGEAGIEFSWIVLGLNIPMVIIGGLVQTYESLNKTAPAEKEI